MHCPRRWKHQKGGIQKSIAHDAIAFMVRVIGSQLKNACWDRPRYQIKAENNIFHLVKYLLILFPVQMIRLFSVKLFLWLVALLLANARTRQYAQM